MKSNILTKIPIKQHSRTHVDMIVLVNYFSFGDNYANEINEKRNNKKICAALLLFTFN